MSKGNSKVCPLFNDVQIEMAVGSILVHKQIWMLHNSCQGSSERLVLQLSWENGGLCGNLKPIHEICDSKSKKSPRGIDQPSSINLDAGWTSIVIIIYVEASLRNWLVYKLTS